MAKKQEQEITGWVGWVFFAGFMMIIQGFINALVGLTAIFNNEWFVVTQERLLLFDITAWGWFHMLLGLVVFFAGFSVMKGAMWARVVGVLAAGASMVGAMATVDFYPVWSLIIMVIDILVIYALVVHGDEAAE